MHYFVEIVSMVLLLINLIKGQRQGDLCVMAGTIQPGVCRHIMRCSAVLEAAFHGLPYQVCASPENMLIVCCPWVPGQETRLQARYQANTTTPKEGDNCTMVGSGRAGVCSRFTNCQTAKEAAYKGVFPQICAVEGTVQIVCCPLMTVAEGDRCSTAETGRSGKCLRISKCPVAVEAALKGITPQICSLDGSVPVVCCEGIFEGDNCTTVETGRAGVCSRFANCKTAIEGASKGISPQKCDSTESELVCCAEGTSPPQPKRLITQLSTGSKATDYCVELTKKIQGDMCPLLTPDSNREYSKTPMTTAAEAPYYGRIGSGQRENITWAGNPVSLVSDQWVLCSARFITATGYPVRFVGLGGTFTPRYNPDEIYGVSTKYMHPLYNNSYSFVYNDIALLQLDRQVAFTRKILPVCLHTGTPLPNSGLILTGWDGTPSPDFKTSVQILSQEECSSSFPTAKWFHPAGFDHDLEICSRSLNTKGYGSCMIGHHGSPLTLSNSPRAACTHLLVGLKSYGVTSTPCTDPSTRISSFIIWIESIVWPESGVVV